MTADAFARWMALSFPWVHPDGADWRNLRAAWEASANSDRAQIAAPGADPVPAARRSPLEHERDAGAVLDPAGLVERLRNEWLQPGDELAAADLIEALVEECSREFARGYEVGRAVGAVEGPRPMTDAEVDDLLGVKRGGEGKA